MSMKFYRHNETCEVVAVTKTDRFEDSYKVFYCDGSGGYFSSDYIREYLTLLPEAPKIHSLPWAIMMMEQGYKITSVSFDQHTLKYIYVEGGLIYCDNGKLKEVLYLDNVYTIYEEPKVIITKLPHEFIKGEEILCYNYSNDTWMKSNFVGIDPYYRSSSYEQPRIMYIVGVNSHNKQIIPYAGNEHLENKTINSDHGKIPDGYVPPHVPKLGDDDYWMVGDEVIDLSIMVQFQIIHVYKNNLKVIRKNANNASYVSDKGYYLNGAFCQCGQRRLFHKGSTVDKNGTVHEYVPIRPYQIKKE